MLLLSWLLLVGVTLASTRGVNDASPPPLAGSRRLVSGPQATTAPTSTETLWLSAQPTPFPSDSHGRRALMRRATTSAAEASVCGYFNGDKNSRLACGYNWNCVFHSSNADYPALVGCCPISSTTHCQFLTTCYDSAQVLATASLRSLTNDPFVTLCTESDNAYCHAWAWPDLSMLDWACTHTSEPELEMLQTIGSLTDVTNSQDQIFETLSMSWVDDSVLKAITAATTSAESTAGTSATTAAQKTTAVPNDASEAHGSTTPVGKIVGGVVGGVGGVGVIVAAGILYRLRKKKASTSGSSTSGPSTLGRDGKAQGGMSDPIYAAEVDGRDRWYEMAGSRPVPVELPAHQTRHELE